MSEQRTVASVAYDTKGKVTRRERLLREMDAVIPWPLEVHKRPNCEKQLGRLFVDFGLKLNQSRNAISRDFRSSGLTLGYHVVEQFRVRDMIVNVPKLLGYFVECVLKLCAFRLLTHESWQQI